MQFLWPSAVEPPALAADEAHTWAVPLDEVSMRWQDCWGILSGDERERATQFRFDDPRRRFVIARAALRTLLGQYLGHQPEAIEFSLAENGKPWLGDTHANSDLRFNLSHSGDVALIVVAEGCEVGIDVERIREVGHLEQIARRYFHPDEIEEVLAVNPAARDEAFLRCWTGKEAVLKAVGSGITGRLDAFRVPSARQDASWIELPAADFAKASRCWLQQLTPSPGNVAAVASLDAQRRVRHFAFSM